MESKTVKNDYRKIVIKNYFPDWRSSTLIDFIEMGTDTEVVNVKYFEDIRSVALIEFDKQIDDTEFEEIVFKGKEKTRWRQVEITLIENCDGILFNDISRNVADQEIVDWINSIYPEEIITNKKRYSCNHLAVYIDNIRYVNKLLKCDAPMGTRMEKFYELFHEEALREKEIQTTKQSREIEESNDAEEDDEESNDEEEDDEEEDNEFYECEDDLSTESESNNGSEESMTQVKNISVKQEDETEHKLKPTPRKPPPLMPKPTILKSEVNITSIHEIKLLKNSDFVNSRKVCKVRIEENLVLLEGTEYNINKTKVDLFEKLTKIHTVRHTQFSQSFLDILRSPEGVAYIDSLFSCVNHVSGFLDDSGALVCMSFNYEEAKKFLLKCLNSMTSKDIIVKPGYEIFLSAHWLSIKQELECGYLVRVRRPDKTKVTVDGFGEDVKKAEKQLMKKLDDNQYEEKMVIIAGESGRYLDQYSREDLHKLEGDVRIHAEMTDNGLKIKLSGKPQQVLKVENYIITMKKSIWQMKLSFNRDMHVSSREVNLLYKGILHCNQKKLKSMLEQENRCCLEFLNLSSSPALFRTNMMPTPPSFSPRPPKPKPRLSLHHSQSPRSTTSASLQIGQTTVTVKKGDITRDKNEILVDVLNGSGSMKQTAIGQAFYNSGGRSIGLELDKEKTKMSFDNKIPPGTVIVTGPGRLRCKSVYHIILDKYKDFKDTQTLGVYIKTVLKKMTSTGLSSVSFPSLGCGRLFKYPPSQVAAVCLVTLKQELPKYSGANVQNVDFVIYDDDVYQEFSKEFIKNGASSSPFRFGGGGGGAYSVGGGAYSTGGGGASSLHSTSSDSDGRSDSDDDVDDYIKVCNREDDSDIEHSEESGMRIYAADEKSCKKVMSNLIKYLKDNYLFSDEVQTEAISRLDKSSISQLKNKADISRVSIKFPEIRDTKTPMTRTPKIKLQGEKSAVQTMKIDIQSVLLENKRATTRPKRGSIDYIKYMAKEAVPKKPSYWKHSKSTFKNISRGENKLKVIDNSSPIYHDICQLVQNTWKHGIVGHGKDASGLNHSSIEVTRIERLEDEELYFNYWHKRKLFFLKAHKNGSVFKPIESIPHCKIPVLTTQKSGKTLTEDIFPEVNEHFLFHGTRNVDGILKNGLDPRMSSPGMFGSAVYLAESSTKADQYTDDKTNRSSSAPLKMLLVRTLIGNTYVSSQPNNDMKRPPCMDKTHGYKHDCKEDHEIFDSVLGQGKWNFREFAIYDMSMMYPEYIITYKRK